MRSINYGAKEEKFKNGRRPDASLLLFPLFVVFLLIGDKHQSRVVLVVVALNNRATRVTM